MTLHNIRFPGESDEYRRERDRLLETEVELRQAIERVATQRRALPLGGTVPDDYSFEAADGGEVRFSELFTEGKNTLVIYNFMFPRHSRDTRPPAAKGETATWPLTETPCPSCTSILDGLNGAAPHLAQRLSLVVVAKSDPTRIGEFAGERGWRNPAAAVFAKQHLQPRLPRRDRRRRAAPDPQRVRARSRAHPAFLGF